MPASPSTASSSASRTSWPMPPRAALPKVGRSPSTRCSSMVASAWARPTSCMPSPMRLQARSPRAARALPVGRTVHVPLRAGPARTPDHGLQGAVPVGRRADGRRRAVHRRQGQHAGRILSHLQRAGRSEQADRHFRRPRARARSRISKTASAAACNAGSWSTCIRPTTNCASGILQQKADFYRQQYRGLMMSPTACWNFLRTASRPTSACSKAR